MRLHGVGANLHPQAKTSVQIGLVIAKVEKDNWKTATISDFSIHREYRKTLIM